MSRAEAAYEAVEDGALLVMVALAVAILAMVAYTLLWGFGAIALGVLPTPSAPPGALSPNDQINGDVVFGAPGVAATGFLALVAVTVVLGLIGGGADRLGAWYSHVFGGGDGS